MKNAFIFLLSFLFLETQFVFATSLPSGENVISGDISISSSQNSMTITQSSEQSIIEWTSFDIGAQNSVTFNQPSIKASALNRVASGNPTTLAGALNANGKVFVVNENGVYFTPTSTINAHSFAASTLALSNDDFLNNKFLFKTDNVNNIFSSIIHKGSITTLDGGFTALLGGAIDNEGTINANLGKIGIGAGKEITLDLSGDKFLQVSIPFSEAITLLDQNFINTFVDIAVDNNQPGLVMFLHGNERTVNLLEQFTNTVLSRLQELQTSGIFKHHYGSDSMLTNEVKDLIYSYIPIQLNKNTTIVAQATSQSSEEFQTYANIMLNAGVNPNSPYSAISFDTMMLAALALQHQVHNNISKEDLSKSLVSVANPPGIQMGPGSWEAARALIVRGVEINYEGVSGSLDFDINGDVEGMYSLNQVTEDNLWAVERLEKLHPFEPRIIID